MLSKADFSIESSERLLAPLGVAASYIAPTPTALKKSIIDATEGVRTCLRRAGIHDFDKQPKGQDHKRVVETELFSRGSYRRVKMSLYRPETKDGDPRLWISHLGDAASPHNLLAVIPATDSVLVLNMSDDATRTELARSGSLIRTRLDLFSKATLQSGDQILSALRSIAAKGWIRGSRTGSTSVGMTLERELGVEPNSAQAPDFLGFEIKAKVINGRSAEDNVVSTRHTLFAKVPDWDISNAKSSKEIVIRHGYPGKSPYERRRLYCTISAKAPNSQGLRFSVDEGTGQLIERYEGGVGESTEVARWRRTSLESKLDEKHRQTAWVFANSRGTGTNREFRFVSARVTWNPRTAALINLLQAGVVTMDHLIKQTEAGKVTEKGPLFKIGPMDFALLFPHSRAEQLS
ncbi:MAG: hypothetical protein RL136_1114 [Planctomycetota bacterium]|jgi:hypothetical protein